MYFWIAAAFAACPVEPALTMRAELYLGRERHGVPYVGPARWSRFLATEVTPRFPGFSVIDQQGYWEGAPERSRLLVILHDEPGTEAVRAIADAYQRTFEQESVLLVEEPVVVSSCAARPISPELPDTR